MTTIRTRIVPLTVGGVFIAVCAMSAQGRGVAITQTPDFLTVDAATAVPVAGAPYSAEGFSEDRARARRRHTY